MSRKETSSGTSRGNFEEEESEPYHVGACSWTNILICIIPKGIRRKINTL